MLNAAVLGLLLAAPGRARAADSFLDFLRRAERLTDADEKVEYFDRAIRAWSRSDGDALLAECHYGKAKAYAAVDRHRDALAEWNEALRLDPNITPAYLERGALLSELGRAAQAVRDLDEFVSRKPDDLAGLLARGEAYRAVGRYRDSEKDYAAALQNEAADYRARLGLGRALHGQGRCAEALDEFSRAFAASDGRCPDALYYRAVCEVDLGRSAEAGQDFDAAVSGLETLANEAKRAKASEFRLGQAFDRLGKAYYQRGRLRHKLGRFDEARADYRRACRAGFELACSALQDGRAKARAQAPEAPPELAPPPTPVPVGSKKKRRARSTGDGPGERVYAR